MRRTHLLLGALLLIAAPVRAHQETVAYSRLVIHESGDVDYALKIPVEDLGETLGRDDHAALGAPEIRGAEERLFRQFEPLVSVSSGGTRCPAERAGIEVPEDERLYGELRFIFRCPPGAPVTLDYRVFFDVDPGHMGMLEVESAGGKARAELIVERPRWDIVPSADGPPELRFVEGAKLLPLDRTGAMVAARRSARPQATAAANIEEAEPFVDSTAARRSLAKFEKPTDYGTWALIAVVVLLALTTALLPMRAARR